MAYNYDPEKAHAYYMEYTKKGKLKGRSKRKKATQQQKEVVAYVKAQMDKEKKYELEAARAEWKEIVKKRREEINAIIRRIKNKYKMKNNSKRNERARDEAIEKAKELLKADLDKIKSDYKSKTSEIRSRYRERLEDEKDKIIGLK